MSLESGAIPFRLLPGVRYKRLPNRPEWESDLHLDLLLPRLRRGQLAPAIVYFHGGAWEKGGREQAMYPWLNPLLAARGFVTASVTYRLTDTASYPAQLEDAPDAVAWLRSAHHDYAIDPDRIGVWGDSAGAHLALLLGCAPRDSQSMWP